jgi:mannan endo-1,6-alpha-mannosidase
MSALEVTLSTLVGFDDPENRSVSSGIKPPVTNTTGGTSESNPNAGHNFSDTAKGGLIDPAQRKDRIGGWVLTAVLILAVIAAVAFLSTTFLEDGRATTIGGKAKEKSVFMTGAMQDGAPTSNGMTALEPVQEETKQQPRYRGGTLVT